MRGTWLYVKLAWRNLLRNKRRTFIAGTAIGMGLAALVFTDALMIGMNNHLVHSGTASFMGEGQIHVGLTGVFYVDGLVLVILTVYPDPVHEIESPGTRVLNKGQLFSHGLGFFHLTGALAHVYGIGA